MSAAELKPCEESALCISLLSLLLFEAHLVFVDVIDVYNVIRGT